MGLDNTRAECQAVRAGARAEDRRQFLKQAGAAPAMLLAAQAAAESKDQAKLPQIQLGQHRISRLICGANPFNAGSHLSVFVNYEMKRYYTPEQILKTLRRCYEVGINCWASGRRNDDLQTTTRSQEPDDETHPSPQLHAYRRQLRLHNGGLSLVCRAAWHSHREARASAH